MLETQSARVNDDGVLLCPYCGYDYLHHERVEVYWRESEDSERGTRVDSEKAQTNVYPVLEMYRTKNPSGRRDGVRIVLTCEGCNNYSYFYVAQNKGRTFLEQNQKISQLVR